MSLNLYKPLGDNDETIRLSAATQLASELLTLLEGERTVKTKSDVDYALSRLTKGLASGRDSARPGFAVVLTELLTALQSGINPTKWDISLEKILVSVKNNTQPQGHTTGPEERDCHLGRLFGLQSLIQSGITTANESTLPRYAEILTMLFELSRKKPWLRESCAWTICASAQLWPDAVAARAAGLTYSALVESGLVKSSEGVAIWLTLQAYHPGVALPKNVWVKDSPLNMSNLPSLGKVLKEAGGEEGSAQQKGSWNPKLHFVWEFILGVYFDEEGDWAGLRKGDIAEWKDVWKVVVDESLFSTSSSDERKFHGFLLFTHALSRITTPSSSPHLSSLFSKNFLRSLTNQLSDASRYLNKAAAKCTRALLVKAETAPWTIPAIVQQLVSNNGTPSFDVQTKSKTVEKVLCFADEDGLVEIVSMLKNIVITPITAREAKEEQAQIVKTAEVRRQWAADLILTVIKNGKSPKTDSWLNEVVTMFATFGHFDIINEKEAPDPPVSVVSQGMFGMRLLSCLSHLITIKEETAGEGTATWPYKAVRAISTLQKDNNYKLAVEVDDTIEDVLRGALKTLERIRKKRTNPKKNTSISSQLSSFELLYSLVILQVHAGETDALGVLDELQICYDKVVKSKASSSDDEDVDASEVLVEILLSFLSKPSVLLRKLATQVFSSFVGRITGRGLGAMFGVLETKESLGGQAELFDRDEDEEDMEMEDGGEEIDSDAEMDVDDEEDSSENEEGLSSEDGNEDNDDDDDDDDDDYDEEEEQDESEAAKLEAALSEALGAHKATEDSNDSDIDDDTMLALDEQLANIFKQRSATAQKSKKQESRHAKESITNFKNRVLDLLDIYAKSSRAREEVAISTKMLLPLLRCARITGNRPVADHAANVIKIYANALRGKEGDVVLGEGEKEELWGLLEEIHKEAAKDGGVGREKRKGACSQASLVVVKLCVASGGMKKGDVERAVGVYARSLTMWLTDRSWRVQSGLFTDLVNWAGTASRRLQNEGK